MINHHDSAAPTLTRFRTGALAWLACRLAMAGLACLLLVPGWAIAVASPDDGVMLTAIGAGHCAERSVLDVGGAPVPAAPSGHHVCSYCLVASDHGDHVVIAPGASLPESPAVAESVRLAFATAVYPMRLFLDGRESRAPPATV